MTQYFKWEIVLGGPPLRKLHQWRGPLAYPSLNHPSGSVSRTGDESRHLWVSQGRPALCVLGPWMVGPFQTGKSGLLSCFGCGCVCKECPSSPSPMAYRRAASLRPLERLSAGLARSQHYQPLGPPTLCQLSPALQWGRNPLGSLHWRPTMFQVPQPGLAQERASIRPEFNPWVGKIPWRKKWQPSPVFLPGESHGQRNLAGYRPWGHNWATKHSTAWWRL